MSEHLPDAGLRWLASRARFYQLAAVPALDGRNGTDIVLRIDGTYASDIDQTERLARFARLLTDTLHEDER